MVHKTFLAWLAATVSFEAVRALSALWPFPREVATDLSAAFPCDFCRSYRVFCVSAKHWEGSIIHKAVFITYLSWNDVLASVMSLHTLRLSRNAQQSLLNVVAAVRSATIMSRKRTLKFRRCKPKSGVQVIR